MKTPTLILVKPAILFTDEDQELLGQLEAKVESAVMEFAQALFRIKSHKGGVLWRSQGYESFEDYCQSRFDFKRQHAYRLAAAGEFVSNLDTAVPRPLWESQVRPIINKIKDPAQRRECWAELTARVEPSKLTASYVEAGAAEYCKKHGIRKASQPAGLSKPSANDSSTQARDKCVALIEKLKIASSNLPESARIHRLLSKTADLIRLEQPTV
jgi:hypothetical protein